jgi:hypothetical protein
MIIINKISLTKRELRNKKMTIQINNLSTEWQCPSITLRLQAFYMHNVPANFASDKERDG